MKSAENDRLSPANIQRRIQELREQMEKMPEYERGAVSYGVIFNSSALIYHDTEPGINPGSRPSSEPHTNNNQNKRTPGRWKR